MLVRPDSKEAIPFDIKTATDKILIKKTPTLFFDGYYFDVWGHFILDSLYPFYVMWKSLNLKPKSFNILCRDRSNRISSWGKVSQIISDLFKPKKILNLETLNNSIVFVNMHYNTEFGFFSNDSVGKTIQQNLKDHFKEVGFRLDETLKAKEVSPDLNSFVEHCIKTYNLEDISVQHGLVTLAGRTFCRKIKNLSDIGNSLKQQGYTVETIFFENLSFKDQIKQMLRTEILISSYGSNVTNGIFLHPNSKFIVCWPYDAKCFWSRKYCILHSAILCRGMTIYEFDKDHYDQTDTYTQLFNMLGPESYFYRDGNVLRLRDEKKNYQGVMDYPQPASYDLLNVDLTVDINRFKDLKEKLEVNSIVLV